MRIEEAIFANPLQCIEEVKCNAQHFYSSYFMPALDGGVFKLNDCIAFSIKQSLLAPSTLVEQSEVQQLNDTFTS